MGLLNDDIEGMDHADLYNMREKARGTPDFQALAPAEHQAFARQWTQENPMVAAPSLAIAAPLYYLAKQPPFLAAMQKLGIVGQDATPANFDQLSASYRGIGQGLGLLSTPPRKAGTGTGT